MRKTLMALMFAATLPAVAMAMPPQGGPLGGPGMGGPGMMMHHDRGPMAKLNLTPEQRQQVGHLMGEQMQGRFDITRKYLAKLSPADQKAMKDELAARHQKADADIRALLTPEQQKQFDQNLKDREQRRADRAEFEAWKADKAKKTAQ